MACRIIALVIAFSGIVASTAAAQPASKISQGQRVRITNDRGQQIGTVAAISADGVRLTDGARETTIAFAGVKSIEVSRGRESKWKKYAVRGAIISGAIGAVSLGLQHEEVGENGSSFGKAAALGAWSGGLFGGAIGGAIGAAKSADHWERVWP